MFQRAMQKTRTICDNRLHDGRMGVTNYEDQRVMSVVLVSFALRIYFTNTLGTEPN